MEGRILKEMTRKGGGGVFSGSYRNLEQRKLPAVYKDDPAKTS